jgi:hypothetical protein
VNSRPKRGLAAAVAFTGLGIGALQIGDAGAIDGWRTFGHSVAHVRGTEGHRSINDVRSTTGRNPELVRFVIKAPFGVDVHPGIAHWSLFCWNEFDDREASASARLAVDDRVSMVNVSERVPGGVDSYQFCELRVDVRQGNRGNVRIILQAHHG